MLALWSAAAWAAASALDSAGRRVWLPAPAQRIVSVAPHVTELLFAAGAGSRVVAVSEYSDYPEVARRLPRVASSGAVNVEEVLALRADLVVAWRLDATARSLDRLEALGIPVFYSEPHRLAEIPNAIEALGLLAGTEAAARAAAQTLRSELEQRYVVLPAPRGFSVLLRRADLVIANNSGVVHLAAAGGRPTLAIYSGTHQPQEWGPRGSATRVLMAVVPCSPCGYDTLEFCPHDYRCMRLIEPETVFHHAVEILSAAGEHVQSELQTALRA